jgi:hypothetical protein
VDRESFVQGNKGVYIHDKFSEKIKTFEINIINLLDFDLQLVTAQKFIKFYVHEYKLRCCDLINNLKMMKHVINLEKEAVFFSLIMLHDISFLNCLESSKALACMALACEGIKLNSVLSKEVLDELVKWVFFI